SIKIYHPNDSAILGIYKYHAIALIDVGVYYTIEPFQLVKAGYLSVVSVHFYMILFSEIGSIQGTYFVGSIRFVQLRTIIAEAPTFLAFAIFKTFFFLKGIDVINKTVIFTTGEHIDIVI